MRRARTATAPYTGSAAMPTTAHPGHEHLSRKDLLPTAHSLAWVLVLFGLAIVLARLYAAPIGAVLANHARLGVVLFFCTTALAVVLPLFSNLPLVPFAVLLWGPWWTALIIVAGWVAGAAISFDLARRASPLLLRTFPKVARYARIDRLIHPQHHLLSLLILRMTFPADILSYVLGLFSHKTTRFENALSTALGGAPFALLFAFFPALPLAQQALVLAVATGAFAVYAVWVVRSHRPPNGAI
jgi:uncharacterized membrane protein YdjX (TVP38/TMEM64 family)